MSTVNVLVNNALVSLLSTPAYSTGCSVVAAAAEAPRRENTEPPTFGDVMRSTSVVLDTDPSAPRRSNTVFGRPDAGTVYRRLVRNLQYPQGHNIANRRGTQQKALQEPKEILKKKESLNQCRLVLLAMTSSYHKQDFQDVVLIKYQTSES